MNRKAQNFYKADIKREIAELNGRIRKAIQQIEEFEDERDIYVSRGMESFLEDTINCNLDYVASLECLIAGLEEELEGMAS